MTTVQFISHFALSEHHDVIREVVVPHELFLKMLNPGQWMLTRDLRRYVLALVDAERKQFGSQRAPVSTPPLINLVSSSDGWILKIKEGDGCSDVYEYEHTILRRYIRGSLMYTLNNLVLTRPIEECIKYATTNCSLLCTVFDLSFCFPILTWQTQTVEIDTYVKRIDQLRCALVLLAHCVHKNMRIPTIDVCMSDCEDDRLSIVVVRLIRFCDALVMRVYLPHDFDVRHYRTQCFVFDDKVYLTTTQFNRRIIDVVRTNATHCSVRFIVYGCCYPKWIEWTRLRDTTHFVLS